MSPVEIVQADVHTFFVASRVSSGVFYKVTSHDGTVECSCPWLTCNHPRDLWASLGRTA